MSVRNLGAKYNSSQIRMTGSRPESFNKSISSTLNLHFFYFALKGQQQLQKIKPGYYLLAKPRPQSAN
tara:strand:- start:1823 stop:2026 length:204 start_codon:yes stop_codon:yes gene_type:complete